MLFQGIDTMRAQAKSINFMLVFLPEGRIRVTVIPVVDEAVAKAAPEVCRDFALTGTPAELDADFMNAMQSIAKDRLPLMEQALEESKRITESKSAAKPGKGKATDKDDDAQKASKTTTPADKQGSATPGFDLFGED